MRKFAIVLLFAACQTPGDALVPEIVWEPAAAIHVAEVDRPISVPAPPTTAEGCVDYKDSRQLNEQLKTARIAMEVEEAGRRGWRELTEFREANYHSGRDGELTWRDEGLEVARQLEDRVVDVDGNHWLAVEQGSPCYPFEGRFYVDDRKNVFQVLSDLQCAETVKMDGCGAYPGDGCGAKPDHDERRFVRVPKGAKLTRSVGVLVPTETCYAIKPLEGIDFPP